MFMCSFKQVAKQAAGKFGDSSISRASAKASRAFEVSSHNVGIGSDLKGIALFHFKGYQSILGPFGTKSVPCGFVCEMRDYPNRLER